MKKTFLLIIFLLACVLVILGGYFWWIQTGQPVNISDTTKKTFVIGRGEGVSSISSKLLSDGLIRSRFHFLLTTYLSGLTGDIQAGSFRLSASQSEKDLLTSLTKGTSDQWITVVEGLRAEEIGQLLRREGFLIDLSNWQASIAAQKLEGRLFPDTYLLPKVASQDTILAIFKRTFDKKVTTNLQSQLEKSSLSLNQILTLASLVEREAQNDIDRRIVAGILLRRLTSGWPLQVDATVQYAIATKRCVVTTGCDWWPKTLTKTDIAASSLYNTYSNPGLPPFPICNPGLSSIKAVLEPTPTGYWFYLTGKDGLTHYAETNEQHIANIKSYL